jgi:hypothetical protein
MGGGLAAGAVGATAAGTAFAAPVGAAAGDPLILGTANTSGSASTSMSSSASAGTLAVSNTGTGPALAVQGVATFVRSGTVPIFEPSTSVTVPVPGGLKTSSGALAMVQNPPTPAKGGFEGGFCKVNSVHLNRDDSTVTIYLNGSPIYAVKVAWFVFG